MPRQLPRVFWKGRRQGEASRGPEEGVQAWDPSQAHLSPASTAGPTSSALKVTPTLLTLGISGDHAFGQEGPPS